MGRVALIEYMESELLADHSNYSKDREDGEV